MKKLFRNAIFAAAAAVVVASCNNQTPEPTPEPTPDPVTPVETVALYSAGYWGDYYETGTENFYFIFLSDEAMVGSTGVEAAGTVYFLDIVSATQTNLFPASGTYTFDANSSGTANTFTAVSSSISVYDDDLNETEVLFTAGTVTISTSAAGYLIEATVTGDDGKEYKFRYDGPVAASDNTPYGSEPETVSTLNLTMTSFTGTNYEDYYSLGTDDIEIVLESATSGAAIECFGPLGSTTLPTGSYSFARTGAEYTILSSTGYNSQYGYMTPSYVVTDDGSYYFLQSGTMTVTASGLTLNATSAKGSTINISYSGAMDLSSAAGAPSAIGAKKSFGLATKGATVQPRFFKGLK